MTSTKRFDEIGKDDLALAGGKGANVGKFSRAGLPVPDGFAPHRSSLEGSRSLVASKSVQEAIGEREGLIGEPPIGSTQVSMSTQIQKV